MRFPRLVTDLLFPPVNIQDIQCLCLILDGDKLARQEDVVLLIVVQTVSELYLALPKPIISIKSIPIL